MVGWLKGGENSYLRGESVCVCRVAIAPHLQSLRSHPIDKGDVCVPLPVLVVQLVEDNAATGIGLVLVTMGTIHHPQVHKEAWVIFGFLTQAAQHKGTEQHKTS